MDASIVDWQRLGRTVRMLAIVWGVAVVIGAALTAVIAGGLDRGGLLRWVGLGAAGLVATTVVAIAASALRGMLRIGDRGERLASDDVGLRPPQLRRRGDDGERAG